METNNSAFIRSGLLLGKEGQKKLENSTVVVVGIGGVGGICAEALARSQVGHLILIDKDEIEASNINRQIVATQNGIGKSKVDVMKERILSINPECRVDIYKCWYDKNMNSEILAKKPDFIIDCIDSLASKKDLIELCHEQDIPFIVSCGTARKMDPTLLEVSEIDKTSYDPLARNLRQWKKKNRIRKKIPVVYSKEKPAETKSGQPLPSMIFVPASAGLLLASQCIKYLVQDK